MFPIEVKCSCGRVLCTVNASSATIEWRCPKCKKRNTVVIHLNQEVSHACG